MRLRHVWAYTLQRHWRCLQSQTGSVSVRLTKTKVEQRCYQSWCQNFNDILRPSAGPAWLPHIAMAGDLLRLTLNHSIVIFLGGSVRGERPTAGRPSPSTGSNKQSGHIWSSTYHAGFTCLLAAILRTSTEALTDTTCQSGELARNEAFKKELVSTQRVREQVRETSTGNEYENEPPSVVFL